MLKYYHSIRFRIMQISILFTLLLSLILGYASYSLFARMEQQSSIQAAEFNLRLITNLISQQTANLETLSNLCITESSVITFLSASNPTAKQAVDAYEKLNDIYSNNASSNYVQRLIVTDGNERLLQLGSPQINSVPLTKYNIAQFPYIMDSTETSLEIITQDPLIAAFSTSMPLVKSVYARGQIACGKLYISVSTELITDQFTNYQLDSDDILYLNINNKLYRILENNLTLDDTSYTQINQMTEIARDPKTFVAEYKNESDTKYIVVSSPVGNTGISISHYIAKTSLGLPKGLLFLSLLLEFVILQIMGFTIYFLLKYLIMRPVNQLQKRLSAIASGNFSLDTSVEWDNELGNIGRGINQLSRDVQNMMDARVADEKERQRLEYKMLQSQISPHFIYNALNSIKWMATIQKSTGIAEMTGSLSHLLKYLSKNNEDLIPLCEELALLNDYCIIQRYRYGNGISWEIDNLEGSALPDCLIPRFTLQPLIENAIFHGIEPNGGIGHIYLTFERESETDFYILISDDGIGMTAEIIQSVFSKKDDNEVKFLHTGMLNVHRRIQYAFGSDFGIDISSTPGKGTDITIHLPKYYLRKEIKTS